MKLQLLLTILIVSTCLHAQFGGGSGTEADPWQIAMVEHLNSIRNYLGVEHNDKYFLQTADIDLGISPWNEGEGWVPIGDTTNSFTGIYNGGEYSINGLYINRPDSDYQGLFGYISVALLNVRLYNVDIIGNDIVGGISAISKGEITSSTISGSISGKNMVGGITGLSFDSSISYCESDVNVFGSDMVGGLVGHNLSVIDNSSSSGIIIGNDYIGGLVGWNGSTSIPVAKQENLDRYIIIDNCFSSCNVTGNYSVGGLVGYINESQIDSSYSIGSVTGNETVGGLIGFSIYSNIYNSFSKSIVTGTGIEVGGLIGISSYGSYVNNCFSIGAVSGNTYTGGLIGLSWLAATNSYWDIETSGQNTSAGGEGRTTAEMTYPYSANTYIDWDFTEIWSADPEYMYNNGYPYLREMTTSVDEVTITPVSTTMKVYPNPFNPVTNISFTLAHKGKVNLAVYNIKGELVKNLLEEELNEGEHTIQWSGVNNKNQPVSSGVYFYHLQLEQKREVVKGILLK